MRPGVGIGALVGRARGDAANRFYLRCAKFIE